MKRRDMLLTAMGLGAAVPAQVAAGFAQDFSTMPALDMSQWHRAHYVFDNPHFDTDWDRGQAHIAEGLTLALRPHDVPRVDGNRFVSGSVRRMEPTRYGRYETTLIAARGDGIVTGSFLYTGPAYGTQHDEIDWEIFGGDTRTAQVAWFKDGKITEQRIDLGFDAAEAPHRYGIEWGPDAITWRVDGDVVFHTKQSVPRTPMRYFFNLWAVSPKLASWAGTPAPGIRATAHATRITH
ncbi:MAG: family 16 glycosylhydrolase, partial [Pseudomonadota bacterium]